MPVFSDFESALLRKSNFFSSIRESEMKVISPLFFSKVRYGEVKFLLYTSRLTRELALKVDIKKLLILIPCQGQKETTRLVAHKPS